MLNKEPVYTHKVIKEYPRYTVVDVYKDGVRLYPKTIDKPLPTDAENYQLCQKLDVPIVVTAEEKEFRNKTSVIPLTPEKLRVIQVDLKNEAYGQHDICKKHRISLKTLKKIKDTPLHNFVINREEYALD